ncbi:DNA modification system-associated small protein [Sphingomonas flavalba]|uniref:DNA modification system-associated small protein n=1 Tax=Sphingomonas flavalba TaxID=2559804 RepID=UPI0039E13479
MKKMNEEDLALQTLLAARAEVAPDVDESLLRACYAIQRRHQFNNDRTQSSVAMERLIDELVDATVQGASEQ